MLLQPPAPMGQYRGGGPRRAGAESPHCRYDDDALHCESCSGRPAAVHTAATLITTTTTLWPSRIRLQRQSQQFLRDFPEAAALEKSPWQRAAASHNFLRPSGKRLKHRSIENWWHKVAVCTYSLSWHRISPGTNCKKEMWKFDELSLSGGGTWPRY